MRSIKSAERTLALFELFSLRQEPLTVGAIAKALNAPQPSVSMLLQNLLSLGYVAYDARRRTFLPTIRVILLGSWISRTFSEAGEISSRLSQLQRALRQAVLIGIQNGPMAQYVLRQEPEDENRLAIPSAELRPLTCSAVGKILLSLKPDLELLTWVRRCNAQVTDPRHRVQEATFLSHIQEVRARGYAETRGDWDPTRGAVAVSVPSPVGETPIAIAIGGLLSGLDPKRAEVVDALLRFKAEFTASLPAPAA